MAVLLELVLGETLEVGKEFSLIVAISALKVSISWDRLTSWKCWAMITTTREMGTAILSMKDISS